ncbi:GIY-YIG nuclease family protein [Cytobacillus sp. IB215665]|uniref:GIY-YIG nuclease family protein n=1 Tax=Cytobacillus sp. IB215665 TaxID=3097357 RepID=UPI002A0E84F4|nr:GIY-YIG nuclease family protein [Cytobacillus sp. IB215665]MDX8367163.1 GIY-YIG nuclease family protein [Cytobacillus sp. IB215665]
MFNFNNLKKYKEKIGVYQIKNVVDKKVYVGSTVDLYRRLKAHYNELKGNKHKNGYLQNSWNKYGEINFIVEILEIVEKEDSIISREQYWIDKTKCCDRDIGYNRRVIAESNLGIKQTEEAIMKNSEAKKGMNHPRRIVDIDQVKEIKKKSNLGITTREISNETGVSIDIINAIRKEKSWSDVEPKIIKNKLSSNKILSKDDVIKIKRMLNSGMKTKDISLMYSVSHRTISSIKNGLIWSNVGEEITINKKKKRMSVEDANRVRDMIDKGLSDKEISTIFKTSKNSIKSMRYRHLKNKGKK